VVSHKSIQDILERVRAALSDDQLPRLDFDDLKAALDGWSESEAEHDRVRAELSVLRQDYCARIAGMTKAVVAVRSSRTQVQEAEETLDGLESLDASELIAAYGRAAARFRDAFPASFALHRQTGVKPVKRPEQYR